MKASVKTSIAHRVHEWLQGGGETTPTPRRYTQPEAIKNRVYICGKITGDPNCHLKFFEAECALKKQGYAVMNPARLPDGFEHADYMHICFSMIDVCGTFCLLPDYRNSIGGSSELPYAMAKDKFIHNYEDMIHDSVAEKV